MTNEEAIKELKRECGGCLHPQQIGWCKSHCEIGMAIEALEKQIPKKPTMRNIKIPEYLNEGRWCCPTCGNVVEVDDNEWYQTEYYPACECGQRIDWTDIFDDYEMKWKMYEAE